MCYQTQRYTMYQGDVLVYETSQVRLSAGLSGLQTMSDVQMRRQSTVTDNFDRPSNSFAIDNHATVVTGS